MDMVSVDSGLFCCLSLFACWLQWIWSVLTVDSSLLPVTICLLATMDMVSVDSGQLSVACHYMPAGYNGYGQC